MNWFLRILLTILLLAGWVVLGYLYADFTLGSPKRDKPVEVEIPPDTSLKQIGNILKEKRLIRESYFFSFYAIYKKQTNLKAGVYQIEPDETLADILEKISDGDENVVKVTIPPGFNAMQIANRLERLGFDKEGFLDALNHKKPKYQFELEIPNDPRRPYRLEGYLYPSTYEFRKNAKPEEIVNAMLEQFAKRMNELKAREQLSANTKNLTKGMTIDKWVIVASLVEREGRVKDELPRIAGVIYNRLNSGNDNQILRIDATLAYINLMNGKPAKVTASMKKFNNPYNTYKIVGLPPGPIGSPDRDALEAALKPEKHNYQWYVVRSDNSGRHYFASTYRQHQQFIQMSNKNEANH